MEFRVRKKLELVVFVVVIIFGVVLGVRDCRKDANCRARGGIAVQRTGFFWLPEAACVRTTDSL